jgi:KduI/IolB family
MSRDLELLAVGRNTPGYQLYYLNVTAGPTRRWVVASDPDHESILTPADVAPAGTTRST